MSMTTREIHLRDNGLDHVRYVFPCVFAECKERFKFRDDLIAHLREHVERNEILQCHLCEQDSFSNVRQLVQHCYECAEHRPYVCPFPVCPFAAYRKSSLRKHLNTIHKLSRFLFSVLYTSFNNLSEYKSFCYQ